MPEQQRGELPAGGSAASSASESPPPAASSAPEPAASVPLTENGAQSHVELPDPLPPPASRELARGEPEVTRIFDAYGFPITSGLTHVCKRRVLEPDGTRLTYDTFTSGQTPAQLLAFYEKRLTSRGMTRDATGTIWNLPAGAAAPTRTLRIADLSAQGRHRACGQPPGAAAQAWLVLTRLD